MHKRLLSNAAPEMIAFAARVGQQVSSTNTGGLPGPAQMARLPVCIAAFTTIGPPVTSSRRVNSFLHSALNESSDGFSMMHAMFSMPVSR